MVSKIADVEVIVTDTEAEALILENNLIKKLKPRYNINLRDDKTYPYICITDEPFPRVFSTRRVQKGATYFGPYTDVQQMKRLLRVIRTVFKIRSCTLNLTPENISAGKFQACLDYQIGKCAAPCIGLQSAEAYQETIAQIKQLLNGHTQGLIAQLRARMQQYAQNMQFEQAAAVRDQIRALEQYAEHQKIVTTEFVDRDLFALAIDDSQEVACGVIFKVREGKMIDRQHKYLRKIAGRTPEELMQALLEGYYTEATFYPDEILLASPAEDTEALEAFLQQKKGKKVMLRVPKRGEKAALMRMVQANAQLLLEEFLLQKARQGETFIPRAVRALQRDLRLKAPPQYIECFDISHMGGTNTVASCVVFKQGQPRRKAYRTYKIRSVDGKPDDFKAMREVVYRRYRRLIEEHQPLPDLIVVDGGKGQLSSAVEVLKDLNIYDKVAVIGLAKRLEEVFIPGNSESLMIPRTSSSLRLLQQIRDEAHRTAVAFQRKQRKQRTLHSALMDIPGVGPRTAQKLLRHFGSVKKVMEASAEELEAVVGPAITRRIKAWEV